MAHGKISALERLRWRSRCLLYQGRDAHQRDGVLGHRQHRPCIHALLRRAERRARRAGSPRRSNKNSGRTRCRQAFAMFPKDLSHPPRVWAERFFNVQRWTEFGRVAILRPWNSRRPLPTTSANFSAHCEARNDLASQPARIFSNLSISNALFVLCAIAPRAVRPRAWPCDPPVHCLRFQRAHSRAGASRRPRSPDRAHTVPG